MYNNNEDIKLEFWRNMESFTGALLAVLAFINAFLYIILAIALIITGRWKLAPFVFLVVIVVGFIEEAVHSSFVNMNEFGDDDFIE